MARSAIPCPAWLVGPLCAGAILGCQGRPFTGTAAGQPPARPAFSAANQLLGDKLDQRIHLPIAILRPEEERGPEGPGRPGPASDLRSYWSHGTCQGQGPVRYTVAPMRPEDIGTIIPLGAMVGGHVTPIDHQYYTPKDLAAGPYAYDVYAPADGAIVHIQHRTSLEGSAEQPRRYDDYRVVIEHSCTFWTYYDLITRLDPTIVDQLGEPVPDNRPLLVRVPVKAGQVIGQVGGRTLDIGTVNGEVTLPGFVDPAHYDREPWKVHTVDPFNYFDEPLRSTLLALNVRTVPPLGGKIDYDLDGRLVGNWFKEGTNGYAGGGDPRGYWMGHLAFAYHHIDPSRLVVSVGDYDGQPHQFFVKGNLPDPATITPSSGPITFELVRPNLTGDGRPAVGGDDRVQGVLWAEMLGNRQVRVEVFPGRTAAEVAGFTAAAATYER